MYTRQPVDGSILDKFRGPLGVLLQIFYFSVNETSIWDIKPNNVPQILLTCSLPPPLHR